MSEGSPEAGEALQQDVANVQRFVNDVIALARRNDREDLISHLRAEAARWEEAEATVVVVGEAKRGKSSLINAMLAHPELSPVDFDVATATHLLFRHGSGPARAQVQLEDVTSLDIEIDELERWATSQAPELVQGIEVSVPSELLASGLVLIDTPGVGGLDAAHASVTLAALARADALLFVADAGVPLTQPELRFLQLAASRVEHVLFVMNKADVNDAWAEIAAENGRLLSAHAARFASAPVLPASSLLALEALAQPDTPLAADLHGESGIEAVTEHLRHHVAGRMKLLRLANLTRAGLSALTTMTRPLGAAVAAAVAPDRNPEQLLREEFEAFTVASGEWAPKLSSETRRISLTVRRDLATRIAELTERYDELVDANHFADNDAFRAAVAQELRALMMEVEDTVVAKLAQAAAEIAELLTVESVPELLPSTLWTEGRDPTVDALEIRQSGGLEMASRRVMPLVMGAGVGKTVAWLGAAALAPAILPYLAVAAGVSFAGIGLVGGNRMERKRAQKEFLRKAVGAASREAQAEVDSWLHDAQDALGATLREVVRVRTKENRARFDEHRRLAASTASERERTREAAQQRLGELEALARRGSDLLGGLSRARPAVTAEVVTDGV